MCNLDGPDLRPGAKNFILQSSYWALLSPMSKIAKSHSPFTFNLLPGTLYIEFREAEVADTRDLDEDTLRDALTPCSQLLTVYSSLFPETP